MMLWIILDKKSVIYKCFHSFSSGTNLTSGIAENVDLTSSDLIEALDYFEMSSY